MFQHVQKINSLNLALVTTSQHKSDLNSQVLYFSVQRQQHDPIGQQQGVPTPAASGFLNQPSV